MLFVFDTSTLIAIRQYYLRSSGLFKHFWGWLLGLMRSERIIVPDAAFLELQGKKRSDRDNESESADQQVDKDGSADQQAEKDEFFGILVAEKITPRLPDAAISRQYDLIEELLASVKHDLSEEDQEIMATAKALGATLVTEESPQKNLPKKGSRKPYKMPGACKLPGIDLKCLNLWEFLKEATEGRRCIPNELL
ncbi:MAG: DUF4411 family protein [Ectothiorhodospiraceae bacterium AqS1]|nr:DUF4411 family protein [Ectothiorhodospiraceae bacterium AqS1]